MPNSDSKVFCSFCEEEFESSKFMMDHLMTCGNKTDQCPNCGKYVRRAIFAYHYENSCANPDAPSTDDNAKQTAQPERARVSVKCKYCQQNCDKADIKVHRKNCLRNPENHQKKQGSPTDENFNRNLDRSRQSDAFDDDDDDARIPCEWCFKEVPLRIYEKHAEACRDKEHKRLEEKHRHINSHPAPTTTSTSTAPVTIMTASPNDTTPCKFCKKLMSSNGIAYHQLFCVKNPSRNKNYT